MKSCRLVGAISSVSNYRVRMDGLSIRTWRAELKVRDSALYGQFDLSNVDEAQITPASVKQRLVKRGEKFKDVRERRGTSRSLLRSFTMFVILFFWATTRRDLHCNVSKTHYSPHTVHLYSPSV